MLKVTVGVSGSKNSWVLRGLRDERCPPAVRIELAKPPRLVHTPAKQ